MSDTAPSGSALVVTGEEGIFSIERDGFDEVFYPVAVDLDAAVMQEGLQSVPVVVDVCELFS